MANDDDAPAARKGATAVPPTCAVVFPPHAKPGQCPESLVEGEVCTPACDAGYQLVGETACRSGRLHVATCRPADCAVYALLADDERRGNCPATLAHGESCLPRCPDAGDEPVDVSTCHLGVWRAADCVPKACGPVHLALPPDASLGDCPDRLSDGQSCTPACPTGTSLDAPLRCVKGAWTTPECRPEACDVPIPTHGALGDCPATLAHEASCVPTCDVGFEPHGVVACRFGRTSGDFRCARPACPTPDPPWNGATGTCTADLADGESCTPACDDGYELVEPTTCRAGTARIGVCLPKSCVVAAPPPHGTMGNCPAELAHGQSCQVECERRYRASGDTTCHFGRLQRAQCVAKACALPHDDDAVDGSPHRDCGASLAHGQTCALRCPPEHTATSDTTCAFGTLTLGRCVPDACDVAYDLPHGRLGDCRTTIAHGEACRPECDEGYTLSEPTSCHAGQLVESRCIPRDCPVVLPAHASAGSCPERLAHGAACAPVCDVGYSIAGTTRCAAGTLVSQAECTPDACPVVVPAAHGHRGECPSLLAHGQSCEIACDDGYRPSGPVTCHAGTATTAACVLAPRPTSPPTIAHQTIAHPTITHPFRRSAESVDWASLLGRFEPANAWAEARRRPPARDDHSLTK